MRLAICHRQSFHRLVSFHLGGLRGAHWGWLASGAAGNDAPEPSVEGSGSEVDSELDTGDHSFQMNMPSANDAAA